MDHDDDSFAPLYAKAFPPAFKAAYRILDGTADARRAAEDIAQDAMLKLYAHPHARSTNPVGFAVTCAQNAARTMMRRPWRVQGLDVLDPAAGPEQAPDADLVRQEADTNAARLKTWLAQCVEGLPDQWRDVALLRAQGKKVKDVALALGLVQGTVASSYSRALVRLKACLEGKQAEFASGGAAADKIGDRRVKTLGDRRGT